MKNFSLTWLVLTSTLTYGQDFDVNLSYPDILVITTPTTKTETMIEGIILSSQIITGETTTTKKKAAFVEVIPSSVGTIAFSSTGVMINQIDKGYLIEAQGKHMITVVSQTPFAFKQVLVELGEGPNPPPGPGPGPGPSVDNKYGVGQVAYDSAPQDKDGLIQFSSWYRQAGEYLYGRPSIKVIADADQPNSVFGWLAEQMDAYPCPDVEICKKWQTWRNEVNAAFVDSQKKIQYTREDWYAAFNEVANALEKK